MADDEIARLVAVIETDISKLTRGMADVQASVDSAMGAVEKRVKQTDDIFQTTFKNIAGYGLAYLSVGAITSYVSSLAKAGEELQKLHERTGIGVVDLQKLDAAGRAVGISSDTMSSALDRFGRAAGQASAGQGQLAAVMREFSIKTGSTEIETLLNISKAVQDAGSKTEQYRIVQGAFGRGSAEMIAFLQQGPAAIKNFMDAYNGGMTADTVQKLSDFSRHWKEVEVSMKNLSAGPVATVTGQLSKFLYDLDHADGPMAKFLQVLNLMTAGALNRWDPKILAPEDSILGLQKIDDRIASIRRQMEHPPVTSVAADMASWKKDIDAQFAAQEALRAKVLPQVASHFTAPIDTNKPFDDGSESIAVAARSAALIASSAEKAAAAQVQLDAAMAASDKAAMAGSAEKFMIERADAEITFADEIKLINAKNTAAIDAAKASAVSGKVSAAALAADISSINKTSDAERATAREKQDAAISASNTAEVAERKAATDKIVALQEQVAASQVALSKAIAASNQELLQGTSLYYQAVKQGAIDSTTEALKQLKIKTDALLEANRIALNLTPGEKASIASGINANAAIDQTTLTTGLTTTLNKADSGQVAYDNAQASAQEKLAASAAATQAEMLKGTQAFFDAERNASTLATNAQINDINRELKIHLDALKLAADADPNAADAAVQQKYQDARVEAEKIADANISDARLKLSSTLHNISEQQTQDIANSIALNDQLKSSLTDIGVASLKGFGSMKTAAASALDMIAQLIIKLYVMGPLVKGLFGDPGTGVGGGSLGGLFSLGSFAGISNGNIGSGVLGGIGSLFGFAEGGPVQSRRPIIVGEKGPEWFVPNDPGYIIPNHLIPRALGGSVSPGQGYMVGESGPETFVPNVPGAIMPSGGGSNNPTKLEWTIHVDGTGDKDLINKINNGVSQMMATYDRNLPRRVQKIQNDPLYSR